MRISKISFDFYTDEFVFPPYVFTTGRYEEPWEPQYYGHRQGWQFHFLWFTFEILSLP